MVFTVAKVLNYCNKQNGCIAYQNTSVPRCRDSSRSRLWRKKI